MYVSQTIKIYEDSYMPCIPKNYPTVKLKFITKLGLGMKYSNLTKESYLVLNQCITHHKNKK